MPTLTFGLADSGFWSDTQSAREHAVEKARQIDFRGILLEGPAAVDLDRRSTLPLVGLRRATFEEAFHLRLETRAVIAAISHGDNTVRAAPAWVDKSEEPEDFTPPEGGFPKGTGINPFEIDVRERLPDLPWAPGTHTLVLYLFDQQSNPISVRLQSSVAAPSGGAQGGATAEPASPSPSRAVSPTPDPEAGHNFLKEPGAPDLPSGEGIVLRVDPPQGEGKTCRARGAFRLRPLDGERLDEKPGTPLHAEAEGASALVSITLLVLGNEISGPYLFTLRIPGRDAQEAEFRNAGLVEGYFNVNLLRMPDSFGIPQDYVARALHSRAASEGVKFSLKKKPTKP